MNIYELDVQVYMGNIGLGCGTSITNEVTLPLHLLVFLLESEECA